MKKILKAIVTKRRLILLFLFSLGLSVLYPHQSQAHASLAGFDASNIMDDGVMGNDSTMTASQIQTFLKSKNSCNDTNLSRLTGYNSTSGWIKNGSKTFYYNLKNGHFVCMADQDFNGESAAQIIRKAAQDYSINPQVLIVLLQKEQGLVTDTWPNRNYQYAAATGYDCPDSGSGCSNANAGFKTQIRKAAALFREVLDGGWSNYPVGTNYIQYNPSTSCGGSNINIKNRATSSLYRYTPYQPNSAALAAGWGTAHCGAYGNRNFYNYFTEWFGHTRGKGATISQNLKISPSVPVEDSPVLTSFAIRNSNSLPLTISEMTVAARDEDGNVVNFPSKTNVTINPGEEYKYTETRIFNNPGKHTFWIAIRDPSNIWSRTWPSSEKNNTIRDRNISIIKVPDVKLTSGLSTNPTTNLSTEDTVTSSFSIKNNEASSIKLSELTVAARDQNNAIVNFPSVKDVVVQPGKTYTYSQKKRFSQAGSYQMWIAVRHPSGAWSRTWPPDDSVSLNREKTITIAGLPDVAISRGLKYSPSTPLAGASTGISFVVKNSGSEAATIPGLRIISRDNQGAVTTFPAATNVILSPGEEYQYYKHQTLTRTGRHTISIQTQLPSGSWIDTWPKSVNDSIRREREFNVKTPNISLVRYLRYSPVSPKVGDAIGSSFSIKNNEDVPVTLTEMVVAMRDKNGNTVNFPEVMNITIQPGHTYQYYQNRTISSAGAHRLWIAVRTADGTWVRHWPYSSQSNMIRERTFSASSS